MQELHRSKSKVRHRFIQVDDDTWADSLVRAVTDEGCGSKVMVFAAGKGYADEAAEVLARAGMRVLLYHAGVPMGQREQALR